MRTFALLSSLITVTSLASQVSTANAGTIERLEASVNSAIILSSDVQKFRETVGLRAQLDPLFAGTPLAAQKDKAPSTEIINFLIDKQLIAQQFRKSDSDVEQEINSISDQ